METSMSYTGKQLYVSSDERKWINKIHKLREQYPSVVTILAEPEDNDGCIYARINDTSWLKLSPKRQMSEESKAAAAARMRRFHAGLYEETL